MTTASPSAGETAALYQTTKELITEHAFKIVIWLGVGICATVCILRFCIRSMIFRRLFVEDYLMVAAMAVLIAISAVLHVYLGDLYELLHVQNMLKAPGPDFMNQMTRGLKGDAIAIVLSIVGLWMIKLNFLLFFYRIGYQIRAYLITWWVALALVMACGVINLGMVPYDCMLGDVMHITVTCAMESRVSKIYTLYVVSVVIDVLSDLIIMAFPILIVWKTGLNWRQKLVLSSVFLLVGFTIGVTIVRGSIFGGVYKSVTQTNRQVIDSSWMLFWWYIEFIVSFVIACLISFRSLWSSKRDESNANYRQRLVAQQHNMDLEKSARPSGSNGSRNNSSTKSKWRRFQDDLLTTFADLEGTTINDGDSFLRLQPHLATMDLDFSTFGWNPSVGSTSEITRKDSANASTIAPKSPPMAYSPQMH
ncbi:hypothetical protein SLS60_010056 [Paraconiothyrium brasiliense]|uniref:Rhodopsin domain-containing protein n=1 Tax=Paraconiothyrium brasiliense TaxID=300254 RepID=A0ABR3QQY3_9PLEO